MELAKMSNSEFNKLSQLIYNDYGIKMPESKKVMLEGRLRKRLKANNLDSYKKYCDFIFSEEGRAKEIIHMIDVVSTNKTDFFRESGHFDFMQNFLLPEYAAGKTKGQYNVWSSACSTGEEPYTISMVLEEFLTKNRIFDYKIHCTDISTQVLEKARLGIYHENRIENIPMQLKRRYFLKSKDKTSNQVRVVPDLRKKMSLSRLNLMDSVYKVPQEFDLIFCRNVLIYFDKPTQEAVINKLCKKLKPGGYLFLGHSESTAGLNVPLETIKPTIFKKK